MASACPHVLRKSATHMQVVSSIFGPVVAHCMGELTISAVLYTLKKEKHPTTQAGIADALVAAIREDNVTTFSIVSHLDPPSNDFVQVGDVAQYVGPGWYIAMQCNATRIFATILKGLTTNAARMAFCLERATHMSRSILMCALDQCATHRGAQTERFYIKQILAVKFSTAEFAELFAKDNSGFNAYDLVISYSHPDKYVGLISAALSDWTAQIMNDMFAAHCSDALRNSLTAADSDIPNASTLTLAVVYGNYYAVTSLVQQRFWNGPSDENTSKTNALYAPAVAVVYALHCDNSYPNAHKNRLRIALHLLSRPSTKINQASGTGHSSGQQYRLTNVQHLSAYSNQSVLRLCVLCEASHGSNLMPIIDVIIAKGGQTLALWKDGHAKTVLEVALETRNYQVANKLLCHAIACAKTDKSRDELRQLVESRWSATSLSLMQHLCANADKIQQRLLLAKARNQSAQRTMRLRREFQQILRCMKTLMPLSPTHNQSVTWFAIYAKKSIADRSSVRNANWANMMFEFWNPMWHAQKTAHDHDSTSGVQTLTSQTVMTVLLCCQRSQTTKKGMQFKTCKDVMFIILGMMSRLDCVPHKHRQRVWPITYTMKGAEHTRSASALHLTFPDISDAHCPTYVSTGIMQAKFNI